MFHPQSFQQVLSEFTNKYRPIVRQDLLRYAKSG